MNFKRVLALILTVVFALGCMAACRTNPSENAFVIKYGGKTVNIKTSLYMCFLMQADQEFKEKAEAQAKKDKKKYDNYTELKYEGKDYNTWTANEAEKLAKKYAFVEVQFEKQGETVSDEVVSYFEQQGLKSYWETYLYEKNGVSYNTFKDFIMNTQYKEEMVYDYYIEEPQEETTTTTKTTAATKKGETVTTIETTTAKKVDEAIKKLAGTLRPADSKITKCLKDNFCAVDVITIDVSSAEDATKKTYEKSLKDYQKQLKKGTDFAAVYSNYQSAFGSNDQNSSESNYESVLMSKTANKALNDSDEASENYDEIKKLKAGETKIIKGDSAYYLYLKQDILKDKNSSGTSLKEYYNESAVKVLTKDIYNKNTLEKAYKEMKIEKNDSAIDYYSADKIKFTTTATQGTSAVA